MTKTFEVPADVTAKVEKLQYELVGLKDLIAFLVSNTAYTVPEERICKLQKEVVDKTVEYEKAKLEVEDVFKGEFAANAQLNWNLDFTTSVVTVEY